MLFRSKDSEQVKAQQEVTAKLRSRKDYLINIRGMTEQEAEKQLQEIDNEQKSNSELFGFPQEE